MPGSRGLYLYFFLWLRTRCVKLVIIQWLNRRSKRHNDLAVCSPRVPERESEEQLVLSLPSVLSVMASTLLFSTVIMAAPFSLLEKKKHSC